MMMRERPFLLLGIITAMAVNDPPVRHRLDAKFRKVLAQKTIEGDEKSLDLLQGLLVYIAWYEFVQNCNDYLLNSEFTGFQCI